MPPAHGPRTAGIYNRQWENLAIPPSEAKKHGARVALFGRRIKGAENPLAFVDTLRNVADGLLSPEEGVNTYRDALEKLGIAPLCSLEDDMVLFTPGLQEA